MKSKLKKLYLRIVRSGFGIKTLHWRLVGANRRKKIIRLFRQSKSNEVVLQTKQEVQAMLGAPALLNNPEVLALQKYANLARGSIVEIGAAYGASSLLFLLNKRENVHVYSIDPFIVDSMGEFQATQKICNSHVRKALKDIGKADKANNWNIIPDYSFNVVKNWNRRIDFLFIDGDHRYEAVKKDFDDWINFVDTGGYILFHDSQRENGVEEGKYDKGWPGPTRFCKELLNDKRASLIDVAHSLTIFKKNG